MVADITEAEGELLLQIGPSDRPAPPRAISVDSNVIYRLVEHAKLSLTDEERAEVADRLRDDV